MPAASLRARPPALARRARLPVVTRRWCLPPALLSDPSAPEPVPGIRILHEHDGDGGLLLWQCYRDVTLWAEAPAEARATLFRASTDAARWLLLQRSGMVQGPAQDALGVLFTVTDGGAMLDPACVAWGCSAVARWAEARGAVSTAISFAQAAAFVLPLDGSLALEAGRLAARYRRNAVAETWLRRAVALARRARDKAVYSGALLEHAWVRLQVAPEDSPEAFQRAIRAARRGGQGDVRALAHYGLARAAMARGDYHDAAAETYTALRLLRPSIDNPHLPLVVLDHAEALLRAESPAAAAAALVRFLHTFTAPRDRIRALTLLVRTSRADGAPPVAEVWHEAVALLGSFGESEDAARGFLALGRAAAETRHDTHAENAARRALAIATWVKSTVLAAECTAFVDQLRGRRADG